MSDTEFEYSDCESLPDVETERYIDTTVVADAFHEIKTECDRYVFLDALTSRDLYAFAYDLETHMGLPPPERFTSFYAPLISKTFNVMLEYALVENTVPDFRRWCNLCHQYTAK